jgi:Zn finger protein HypA/HybF involved in hydrogenase expression
MCFFGTLTEITEFTVERDKETIECAYGEHEMSAKETAVLFQCATPNFCRRY